MRPMVAATIEAPAPLMPSDERRSIPGYRRHRQAAIDSIISKQARDRELEDGLAVILERKETIPGYRRQVVQIVDGIEAGQSVTQIAQELGVHASTVERRLVDVRKAAAVSLEAEQLSGPCPPAGQNDGLGPDPPLDLGGVNNPCHSLSGRIDGLGPNVAAIYRGRKIRVPAKEHARFLSLPRPQSKRSATPRGPYRSQKIPKTLYGIEPKGCSNLPDHDSPRF
jgi:hypothetical protein